MNRQRSPAREMGIHLEKSMFKRTEVFVYAPLLALAITLPSGAVAGGTYTENYVFETLTGAGSTGAWPIWELVADSKLNDLYGVAPTGGKLGGGTIYRVRTDGKLKVLRDFGPSGDAKGSSPNGPLLQVKRAWYGVAERGGNYDKGVLYKWTPGKDYRVIYHFGAGTSGVNPSGPLLEATDGNLYGTTNYGGTCGRGSVFKLIPDTGAVSVVHSFCDLEGDTPITGVIQATDGNLYGTAYTGGPYYGGTLFRLSLSGTFTRLHDFGQATGSQPRYPSRLVQARNGLLYGTSYRGGQDVDVGSQPGTIFSSTLSGTVSVLKSFLFAADSMQNPSPYAALNEKFIGIFYGVTNGSTGGSLFQYRVSSNSLTSIYNFVFGQAYYPKAGLTTGPDGNLWGQTTDGESTFFNRYGTIYSIQNLVPNP
jgi:uncharacterized repeat protein (TIGR03803 family)